MNLANPRAIFGGGWWEIVSWLFYVVLLTVSFVYILSDTPRDIKVREACDRYVAILLYSDNPLEVTRAGVLVDQMNCSIRRRL